MRSKFLKWFFIVGLLGSGTVYSALILVLFPFAGRSGRYWLAAQWCRAMVAWMRWLPGVTCSVEGLEHLPAGGTHHVPDDQEVEGGFYRRAEAFAFF